MIKSESHYINQLKKNGFTKINNFVTKKKINLLKKLVEKYFKKNQHIKYNGVPKRDKDDKIIYNLQNKNYEFIKIITRRHLLNIAKYFLNDPYYRFIDNKYPNFNLLYFNARSSGKKLDLHIDSHIPFKGKKTNVMQFLILLEDSNIQNGCTSVVPGTHLSGKFTDRKTKKIIPLTGNSGDLLIWDSRLWHGTYENKTNKTRWAIVATFGAWWVKPMMDITRSLPNKIYKNCTKIQKQVLGFCSIPPRNEFDRINTKTGHKNLKKDVYDYF